MTKGLSNNGFSIVEMMIVLVVIAVLGLGGYLVWERNKDDTPKSNNTSQNESEQQAEDKPADPSEGGKYLVIKEWGVRFALPEELRGDIYYKVGANDLTKLQRASFASSKLDALVGDFSCSFKENPKIDGLTAGVLRLQKGDQAALDYTKYLNYLKDLEDFKYFTPKQTSPPITCLTNQHEEHSEVERTISGKLSEAFTGLESIEE